eukprot:TRINITY_DN14666_c0_g2_i1.p2 TRINITY_DN14666_c0_g2~~TRINITY_DN14666_c0_g2_i1.p2  ORF type:complete len:317 (+),score=78.23 TRINITY_DN14666_c0_g2_i1:90-953(+)
MEAPLSARSRSSRRSIPPAHVPPPRLTAVSQLQRSRSSSRSRSTTPRRMPSPRSAVGLDSTAWRPAGPTIHWQPADARQNGGDFYQTPIEADRSMQAVGLAATRAGAPRSMTPRAPRSSSTGRWSTRSGRCRSTSPPGGRETVRYRATRGHHVTGRYDFSILEPNPTPPPQNPTALRRCDGSPTRSDFRPNWYYQRLQMRKFLMQLNLDQFYNQMARDGFIDLKKLDRIKEADLEPYGMTREHRRRLLTALARRRTDLVDRSRPSQEGLDVRLDAGAGLLTGEGSSE